MLDDFGEDQLQQAISYCRSEMEYIREMLDPKKRVREAGVLLEDLLRTDFLGSEHAKSGLGKLLRERRRFLGRREFDDADFAVEIRNRVSHTRRKPTTDEQLDKATEILLAVTLRHIQEMEQRVGRAAEDASEPEIEPERLTLVDREFATSWEEEPHAIAVERESRPLLAALDDDPKVTASTLAEYVFCPRAAILTHEGGYSDPEEELPSQALLPWYEQDAIEEAYVRSVYTLFALPVGFLALLVAISLIFLGQFVYPFLLFGVVGFWTYFAKQAFVRWRELGERRLAANLAVACDPDPTKNIPQAVDWWGLLRAGYEVREPPVALQDGQWKLSGKPRRILQKGSMSIPVHRIRKSEGPLSPQHIVRVMAHCHLIESAEGASSPFAIVLYGNTYQGTTVPNTLKNREQFYSALERVRTMINESDAGERQPPEPVTGSICAECPHGRPRPAAVQEKTMHYDEPMDPFLLHNGKKVFHCNCGDRFGWKPKHKNNQRLQRLD